MEKKCKSCELLEAIPERKFPEKESDEFDAGYAFCREQMIKFLENEKTSYGGGV